MNLFPHPETPAAMVRSVESFAWQEDGRWHFRYLIEGTPELFVPGPAGGGRADGLWRTTCGEAFVGLPLGSYLEFNFSPSGQWAAYRFSGPREGMREEPAEIEIHLETGENWLAIEAAVHCEALAPGQALGISAVIEESGGVRSYWALAHPDGPPDFHDPSCFTALLANIAGA